MTRREEQLQNALNQLRPMPKPTIDHDEDARMICVCRECGHDSPRERPDVDCLRAEISEALADAAKEAIETQPRTPEWCATYNAAVTGLLAGDPEGQRSPSNVHEWATKQANVARSTVGDI